MSPRTLSLSRELDLIARSVRGARVLTCQWAEAPFGIGFENEDLPHVVLAILVTITSRLELLDQAVRREVDPRLLWSPQNDAGPIDEGDVNLGAWSEHERVKRAKSEVRRWRKRSRSAERSESEKKIEKRRAR